MNRLWGIITNPAGQEDMNVLEIKTILSGLIILHRDKRDGEINLIHNIITNGISIKLEKEVQSN